MKLLFFVFFLLALVAYQTGQAPGTYLALGVSFAGLASVIDLCRGHQQRSRADLEDWEDRS